MAYEDYMREMFALLEYEPSAEQWEIHRDQHRQKQVAGGERAGKSVVGAKEVLLAIPMSKLIWLVGNEYEVPRTEFEYLMMDLQQLGWLRESPSFPKQGECSMVTINGCRIVTKTAGEPKKLGREAPDLILVCEAAQIEHNAYLRLRGRIAEKRGRLVLTGTFEGSVGWYVDYWWRWQVPNDEDAKSFSLPSWSNLKIYPGGRNDPEILRLEAETPHDLFLERYAGKPCPPSLLVAREFNMELSVGIFPYNPKYPAEITVDPGYAGACAVELMQEMDQGLYITDEIYVEGVITEDIIKMCKLRPWWPAIKGGTIDVAGRAHPSTRAPVDIWYEQAKISLRSRKVHVEAGIDTLNTKLHVNSITGQPILHVDYRARGFIAECGGGRSPVYGGGAWLRDEHTKQPLKKNDHACKAIIYYVVDKYGYSSGKVKSKRKVFSYEV